MYAKINYASSLNVQQRYEEAAQLLDEAASLANRLGHDSLVSRVTTRKAHAQVKNADFRGARRTLAAIMPLQERRGYDADLAISLGLLATMSFEEDNFAGARRNFARSLEIERAAGRALGVSDMSFFVGLSDTKLGNYESALLAFEEGLDIARKNNFRNLTIKNLIGKALVESKNGDLAQSCETLARAAMLHTDEIKYVPMTVDAIRTIDCPYPPITATTASAQKI
jgi:tetratricopeptide (TPR) repeat protein